GAVLEPAHQLPRGLESQIESASRALVPATRVIANEGEPIDVVLLALFGTWGEDGRIQGLLDTLGVPYTGSGVLASALAMDKEMAKRILAVAGLDVPRGVVLRGTGRDDLASARSVGLPTFVKPVANGSSVGASIVEHEGELGPAIELAFRYEPPGPNARVLVGRSARRPRSEHDARDDREQSPSQSGARGRDRVRRSSRAPRRLGTRGRAPARTLSSRSRSRARRRPRFPRVGDPARVLSGVLF